MVQHVGSAPGTQPDSMQRHTPASARPRPRRRARRCLVLGASLLGLLYAALSLALPAAPRLAIASSAVSLPVLTTPALTAPVPLPAVRGVSGVPIVTAPGAVTGVPGGTTPPGTSSRGALRVRDIGSRCGEDSVRRDPLSPHRRDVAILVTLANTGAGPVRAELQLRLSPGPVDVACDPVSVPGGGAQTVECWLPLDSAPEAPEVELRLRSTPAVRFAEPPRTLALACVAAPPASRVVVRSKRQAGCPERSGAGGRWSGRVAASAPSHELAYCSYSWQGYAEPDLRSFGGEDWEVDEPVIVPLGGVPLPDVAAVTDDRLGIAEARAALRQLPAPLTDVRLAVLDTAALAIDDVSDDDTSDHGRAVGLAARRVACGDDPSCPVRIDNRLGLPIVALQPSYTEDTRHGGYLGTRAQLAAALHDLLDAWQAEGQRQPLVINLSLGWHAKHDCPELGCGVPLHQDLPSFVAVPQGLDLLRSQGRRSAAATPRASRRAATEAVLLELVRARCLGALVFAAAGNAVGSDRQGPLLPGAWNQLSFSPPPGAVASAAGAFAPECRGFVDPQALAEKPAGYGAPVGALLEAVGATAFEGQVLATTRAGSLPRLNAYGAGITLGDSRPRALAHADHPGWLAPASGTSLSTAIVSGAAARLWAHAGRSVPAHRIADQLHLDARRIPVHDTAGLDRPAELYASAAAPPAREVTACTVPHVFGVPCGVELDEAGIRLDDAARGAIDPLSEVCLVEPAATAAPGLCPLDRGPLEESTESASDCSGSGCTPEAPAVDMYEAPWVLPQPWGISCATCSEFHESFGPFTAYAVELDAASPSFFGAGASSARRPSIVGALIRAGNLRTGLGLDAIREPLENGHEQLRGMLYLDLWVPPSPASLIVRFGRASGTSVPAEVETALIAVEAP